MANVVLIMADQMRFDALGCTCNRFVHTPALDELASRGSCFLQHLTPNQMCSPSRATLFSGRYPRHHRLHRNGVVLDSRLELISHAFSRAGYRTHGVGKFHFQPSAAPAERDLPESWAFWEQEQSRNWRGPYYGFDTVEFVIGESAYCTWGGHYARWLREAHPDVVELYEPTRAFDPAPPDLDEAWKSAVPAPLHYNSWIADRAVDFIDNAPAREPFFLYLSFPDPHHPFSPPAPYCYRHEPRAVPLPRAVEGELERMPPYIREQVWLADPASVADPQASFLKCALNLLEPREQGYLTRTSTISESSIRLAIAHTFGLVEMIDDAVARVLAALSARGLSDETFIIFTSDHGELLGDHGLLHKGPPPYRQLIQVPLLISGPGVPRRRISALTSHLDLKATIAQLTGIDADGGDGTSLVSLMRGNVQRVHEHLFAEFHPRVVPEQYNQSIITDDWRLTLYPLAPRVGELFDRRADPHEHRNLFADPAAQPVVNRLAAQLAKEFPARPEVDSEVVAIY